MRGGEQLCRITGVSRLARANGVEAFGKSRFWVFVAIGTGGTPVIRRTVGVLTSNSVLQGFRAHFYRNPRFDWILWAKWKRRFRRRRSTVPALS